MSNIFGVALKAVALLIVDVVVVMLLVPVWLLFPLVLLPWVLFFIGLALVALHVVAFASTKIIHRFGMPAFVSACASSGAYTLFIILFTNTAYLLLPWRWILIGMLLGTLLFLGVNSLFLLVRPAKYPEKNATLTLRLMKSDIYHAVDGKRQALTDGDFAELKATMDRVWERVEASTPFGRSSAALIQEQEGRIVGKLKEAQWLLVAPEQAPNVPALLQIFWDVYTLIVTREKMFIQ